jgi:hypothetical protein
MKIFGKIPSDENAALSSLNEGVPIFLKNCNWNFALLLKFFIIIMMHIRTLTLSFLVIVVSVPIFFFFINFAPNH